VVRVAGVWLGRDLRKGRYTHQQRTPEVLTHTGLGWTKPPPGVSSFLGVVLS
jgi:hypothetical protein